MGWQAALIKVSVVPSPGATGLERLTQTMPKSCNCPMHNSMVSICGMLKLSGLLLTIATIRDYKCHTNKNQSSTTPTLFSPCILPNCITIPDIPHCSKRPVYIFHTWTILLSLKRKQKLLYSTKLNEVRMYPVSLREMHLLLEAHLIIPRSSERSFAQYFAFHNENWFSSEHCNYSWTPPSDSIQYFYLFGVSRASFP